MSRFFIDRPIFAWVMAIMLSLGGVIAIRRLPLTPYPTIAPPAISINATYPGADAKTVEDSVTQIIEQNMTALDGLIYMSSSSTSDGSVGITLTFVSNTNPDIAQVQVQNRLQAVVPLLPQIVQQQGITVNKIISSNLMAIGFYSEDGSLTRDDMSDYVMTKVANEMSLVEGVGAIRNFGASYAMRIWLDPDKLRAYSLTPDDVVAAIRAQNAQFSVGQLGGMPQVAGQDLNATVTARGRLQTPEQFGNIIVRGVGEWRRAAPEGRGARRDGRGRLQLLGGLQPAPGHRLQRAAGRGRQCAARPRSASRRASTNCDPSFHAA